MGTFVVAKTAHKFRSLGFTLIELLVTISIAAVLLGIAVPSFRSLILGQRIKTASYDMSYTLTFARSEAIKRNNDVVLSPATGGWRNGWTVSSTVGGITTTLGSHEPFPGLNIAGPATSLTYKNDGHINAAASQTFEISSSATAGVSPRCVSINLSGLPNSKTGSC